MSEFDHNTTTTSVDSVSAERETAMPSCSDPTRRALILTALATGTCFVASKSAGAGEDQPGATSDLKRLMFSFSPRGNMQARSSIRRI
jgi:hypothetical protein